MTRDHRQRAVNQPDNRLGVAYLQSTSEIGGSDVSLLRIVEELDKSRFRPVAMLPADGPLVEKLREQGCEVCIVEEMLKLTSRRGVTYLLRYCWNYPRAIRALLRALRRHGVSLIHTNTLHNLYGFMAAALAGKPHVWHVREIVVQSRVIRRVELFLARHGSDRVVATSDAVAQMFQAKRRARPRHLIKIANGIDLDLFHPANDGSGIRAELGIASQAPVVGLVARLDHWKGIDTILDAAAICRQTRPDARFLIVGGAIDGQEKYAEELRQQAKSLGISDVVHFTLWRYRPDDMPRVHAAVNLLVLASSWPEPFGLVLLEAMATGKPVVATNHGGPREICVDGETGLLVPPRDPAAMAEAMLALLNDPIRSQRMGDAGRHRVERLFDRNRSVRQLETLYDELVSSRKVPPLTQRR
jgi:glycosyltransferase involved in cell wall biosynthesis